ncbi:MAG TPA: DNA alkylation repair protein [bacterium]|nr:DNA alkylation repair protein [bacterium]HQC49518.1 DNA alkylation repair protein [bacterium]
MSYLKIKQELLSLQNPKQAAILSRFFKTGPGQYGAGDRFLGIRVPQTRAIVKKYQPVSLIDIQKLLNNNYHEIRLTGVLLLVAQYQAGQFKEQTKIYNLYLKNTKAINNWDLVDLSAPNIVGHYLYNYFFIQNKQKEVICRLKKMASAKNIWLRRIAVVSTFYFIRQGRYQEIFFLTKMLKNDKQDLIHKALGWMLREVGKKIDKAVLKKFLQENITKLPRTTLRYAIEHFPKEKRLYFLHLK